MMKNLIGCKCLKVKFPHKKSLIWIKVVCNDLDNASEKNCARNSS